MAGVQPALAIDSTSYITSTKGKDYFALSAAGKSAHMFISSDDYPGVIRALKDLKADVNRVTKAEPKLYIDKKAPKLKEMVLVGTLGKSPVIDKLVKSKKLDVSGVAGKWETYLVQVVKKPMPGVDQALVIVGSDKRGTIFGIYDVSAQIGVSPWYYWADVPVRQQQNLYVMPGRHTQGEPAIKYRGIFINDEAPALAGWAEEKFGGFNHKFYANVFELILRMKGNYLWPAMWGRAFYVDDPVNPKLADEYGVVIGTSHHEPLMRAHAEWSKFGEGAWNYDTNKDNLQEFWKEGIKRMGSNESIVTIGMRGDGDEPMSEESNIALLERIVEDQRKIIADVTGKAPAETPQMWALYKEVQEYYDKGMRVPDDVTLLLCDDNWGNIRKLPKAGEKQHAGGYGIYYHYDYVGGPRNYKWLNTNPIPRIWEQMHLAYEYGADRVWIVNVGDIKPMEFPTEFFLDYAWNPEKWPAERLDEYTELWAAHQFGEEHASAVADMLAKYAKYNSRRKPELLSPETYSLTNYREAERIVTAYNELAKQAEQLYKDIPAEAKDAYYQLVLYPILACANLNELHVTVAKNHLYAKQGRAATNDMAEKVQLLFNRDKELSGYYNDTMAGGKWSHMMDQTHISYTYWQQPEKDVMPEVEKINIKSTSDMGVAVEGSANWWPEAKVEAVLPELTPYGQQAYYIELFNRGQAPFEYTVQSGAPWLKIDQKQGRVDKEQRLFVSADWQQIPKGTQRVPVTITGPKGKKVVVQAVVNNPVNFKPDQLTGFVESNGYIAIEAEHYTRAVDGGGATWKLIPDLGRTASAMTPFPVTAPSQTPGGDSPHLEYRINLLNGGDINVSAFLSPTLNFHDTQGLRYAVSIDDEEPQVINMHENNSQKAWEEWVANNINIKESKHSVKQPGEHVLKFWMIDPGVVLQKIVVDTGNLKPSYLGPPESYYQPEKKEAQVR
ncbi:glycosyl hydrolase 115 family protein [Pontibacter silvestris]|uniref:Glycosyl hydrolase 115 family protein n=1 Tax=Pontibacter silvestris TaxID=2305183 RepID=A0ABW4WXN1_9BACT|nr:glycosyl hydrolase 115 family protein [Pontibacter silvestris]MCC9136679.1 glycosyl hydrolase 115 family protein [Pontibacter silvestris]